MLPAKVKLARIIVFSTTVITIISYRLKTYICKCHWGHSQAKSNIKGIIINIIQDKFVFSKFSPYFSTRLGTFTQSKVPYVAGLGSTGPLAASIDPACVTKSIFNQQIFSIYNPYKQNRLRTFPPRW
jgi:hypothetical protein